MRRIILTVLTALIAVAFTVFAACTDEENGGGNGGDGMENKILFTIGETGISATLVDNEATEALVEKLKQNPVTVQMEDYGGWEKVGSLGFNLPTSNEQITARPCEFVLYQGNQLVIFYGSNSWSYTRLGRFDNITQDELKEILGTGSVTVTLSSEKSN